MEPHRVGLIQNVQEFMETIWNEPRKPDTVKRIFRIPVPYAVFPYNIPYFRTILVFSFLFLSQKQF